MCSVQKTSYLYIGVSNRVYGWDSYHVMAPWALVIGCLRFHLRSVDLRICGRFQRVHLFVENLYKHYELLSLTRRHRRIKFYNKFPWGEGRQKR
jgi:hypothetical protein